MEEADKSLSKLKIFFEKCKRVWFILKKPSKKEYQLIIKVSSVGILILGFLGFLISIILQSFF